MTLRQRRKPIIPIDIVRDLDAFVKVENDFKQPTTTGGTSKSDVCSSEFFRTNLLILVSIITIAAVIVLSFIHIATFQNNTLKYDYAVDWDHDSKLKINVDMTVAMNCPCKFIVRSSFFMMNINSFLVIGSDVLDITNTNPMER